MFLHILNLVKDDVCLEGSGMNFEYTSNNVIITSLIALFLKWLLCTFITTLFMCMFELCVCVSVGTEQV